MSFSGYLFSGVRDAYPDVDIDSYFTPAGREILDQAEVLCYDDLDAVAQGVNIGELPARPMSEGELPAVLADYLAVPTSGYDRPIFLGHGVHDVMVPIPLSAKLAADMTRREPMWTIGSTWPGTSRPSNGLCPTPRRSWHNFSRSSNDGLTTE